MVANKKEYCSKRFFVLPFQLIKIPLCSLCPLFAAHNAACLAGESPAPAIDCLAG
jgi:hypothetical protein